MKTSDQKHCFTKRTLHLVSLITILAFLSLGESRAATVGYWRFESGHVTNDSGTNALTLTKVSVGPTSIALPASGPASAFPKTIPLTHDSNGSAVQGPGTNNSFSGNYYTLSDAGAMTLSQGMTIEALVNLSATDNNIKTIAGQGGNTTNGSWAFILTPENSARGPRHLLFQWTSVSGAWGTGLTTLDSGLQLTVGHDYYVAFALKLSDTAETGAVFYVQDLTAGTPLQQVFVTHALTGIYNTTLPFTIGSFGNGGPWLGTIDEVRWSDAQLTSDQLLISAPPLFRVSFENSLNAVSTGNGTPTALVGTPVYVAGVSGQACKFSTGKVVEYAEAANLNKSKGSISVWLQAANNGPGNYYCYFREDGPSNSGSTVPADNSNQLWTRIVATYGMSFDLRDGRYIDGAINSWKTGEWHHVVTTWDCKRGTSMYIDGRLAANRSCTWTPVTTYAGFFIGAQSILGDFTWGAAIDELMIYDHVLSQAEVSRDYMRYATSVIQARIVDPFLTANTASKAQVAFWNPDTHPYTLSGMTYSLKQSDGTTIQSGTIPTLTVGGLQAGLSKVTITPVPTGTYTFAANYTDNGAAKSISALMTCLANSETMPGTSALTLETTIDATTQAPLATKGTTSIVSAPFGSYREASSAQHDRFAYNFNVTAVNSPYVAVITYPDDKPRTMEVILQDLNGNSDYQAQTGVFTGAEFATSGTTLQHRITFWPRSANQSLIFMTAQVNCPAAIQKIDIYRLDHFAGQATTGAFTGSVPARLAGLYYEDCVINQNFGTTATMPGFSTTTDRLLDYMRSAGQNSLCYPLVWYSGPLYGSMAEPFQPDLGALPNQAIAGGSRPHPDGFSSYWLKRLNARGIKFSAGLHLHTLPSLEVIALTDNVRVRNGEETIVNVMSDGSSNIGKSNGSDPNFNALDPRVMSEVKLISGEIGDRFKDEPAFGGLTFVLAKVKLFSFGSIASGYNDMNLQRFQSDTGITIPGYSLSDTNRANNSYTWLMANPTAKEAWIAWRCQKLHDYYKDIADTLSAKRADLKLTLDYSIPYTSFSTYANYLTNSGFSLQAMRAAGFDPTLYASDQNIAIAYGVQQDMQRWARKALTPFPSVTTDVETNRSVELAPEIVSMMSPLARTEAILFQAYWEDAIGNTNPLSFTGFPSAHECTWRVSALNPNGFHALESYVAALNNYDALRIAKGGFLISTFGMESPLATFSRALQALPAVRFDDIAGADDPVRVRQKVIDGKNYFYVLNRLPQAASVTVTFNAPGTIDQPVTGATYPSVGQLTISLNPYDFRVYYAESPSQVVAGTSTSVSSVWTNQLKADLDNLKALAVQKGLSATYASYFTLADQLWLNGNYARLYLLLQERWAVKIKVA